MPARRSRPMGRALRVHQLYRVADVVALVRLSLRGGRLGGWDVFPANGDRRLCLPEPPGRRRLVSSWHRAADRAMPCGVPRSSRVGKRRHPRSRLRPGPRARPARQVALLSGNARIARASRQAIRGSAGAWPRHSICQGHRSRGTRQGGARVPSPQPTSRTEHPATDPASRRTRSCSILSVISPSVEARHPA